MQSCTKLRRRVPTGPRPVPGASSGLPNMMRPGPSLRQIGPGIA
jgi:hypothetical protein